MSEPEGALHGVRILDLTDERGIYGAKLLADLGADVVRPVSPTGDPLRARGPLLDDVSLWYTFFASNRREITIDLETSAGVATLQALAERCDILLTCGGAFGVDALGAATLTSQDPTRVIIDVSSFGNAGPWRDYLAPDLVAGALGGAVATTGDVDTPPLKSFGELNFMVVGAYVAIAALAARHHAAVGGVGQTVDISAHECIASCLEHVFMWYFYQDKLAGATNNHLPRRGSLHWSNAYQVMPAARGSIMVTPAPDFEAQLVWLVQEDAHEDLIDPMYQELENRPLLIARMMELMRTWVAGKDAEALFYEAQERHAPYGWVLPVERLADNPQLAAREWWTPYSVGERSIRGPGAPYHFSATPWRLDATPSSQADVASASSTAGAALDDLLERMGWQNARPSAATASSGATMGKRDNAAGGGPLAGIRVLDFTHVLAGPYATRILADMGADVVKVNSEDRAAATNDPTHPYYLMWNRSKRALALDMRRDDARALAGELCAVADVVIDNFSVGVLDRWGIGFDAISARQPGVIYVQMSGMGDGGPWSRYVTYAPTIHALAGLTYCTGVPGREDIGVGFSYNDHQAGLHGAVAILAALEALKRTGRGQRVDVSQFEVGVNFLGPTLLDYFATGNAARPVANRLPYDLAAPHGCYPCKPRTNPAATATENERWVAIAVMSDDQWQSLCELLGDPAWAHDPAFATAAKRVAATTTLDEKISEWTRELDATHVMQACQAAGVPAGVVQTGDDLVERDPQLAGSGFVQPITDINPAIGQTWADALPLHFHATPCTDYRRVREVGEDNAEVLEDWLGMSEAAVAAGIVDGMLR